MSTYDSQLTRKTRSIVAQLPISLRRCLGCDHWMRSTGVEHRLCNTCKGTEWRDEYSGGRVG